MKSEAELIMHQFDTKIKEIKHNESIVFEITAQLIDMKFNSPAIPLAINPDQDAEAQM